MIFFHETKKTNQERHIWEGKAVFTKAIFVANCVGKRFFLVDGQKKAEVRVRVAGA